MIYIVKKETILNVKGCTFVRVALLSPEEVEDLLEEGIYDVAASPEAAEVIRNTYGVKIPKVFQGQPPVGKGDKIILLDPDGQAVDITLVF
jgi:predicted RNA-binding protein with PUA domain